MFTGLVEAVGTVASREAAGQGIEFRFRAPEVRAGLELGDSIAIDGACMTVVALSSDGFAVQTVATSLQRTTFGAYAAGRRVNLERAVSVGSRLGGHLVQGHVDAVGRVLRVERHEELVLLEISMPPDVAAVTVLHGSVTVNGVSLTVSHLPEAGVLGLSIIPYTWSHTALRDLQVGDPVNLEGDTIGKYVRHLLGTPLGAPSGDGQEGAGVSDLLRAWGY